jgi:uncharacterized repeat protein (TIGR03803 family)
MKRYMQISSSVLCGLLLAGGGVPAYGTDYTVTDLYDFASLANGCLTGCQPVDYGRLVRGPDGRFYGTAWNGGQYGSGVIFSVLPDGSGYQALLSLDAATGTSPVASLMLGPDGRFYGTTQVGGPGNNGTIFRFVPPNMLTVLHNFSVSMTGGGAPPVIGADGDLYGVAVGGAVYRIVPKSGKVKFLPQAAPYTVYGPLTVASTKILYGVSCGQGTSNAGTVFSVAPSTGAVQIIYSFSGPDGFCPYGPLSEGLDLLHHGDGYLYGTTSSGAANGSGGVFRVALAGSAFTLRASFDKLSSGTNSYGAAPFAGLEQIQPGTFMGVTTAGGANGNGTIYTVSNTVTGWQLDKILDFPMTPPYIQGSGNTLAQNSDGSYYGVSQAGGTNGTGNLFAVSPIANPPVPNVIVEGPIWVHAGDPVTLLGDGLDGAVQVSFGGAANASFQGTPTALFATAPGAAQDGMITVTLATGATLQSQQLMHILPGITGLDPGSGAIGTQVTISGSGLTAASRVTFGGARSTAFTVVSPNEILATVPARAKTGKVVVTTPDGAAASAQNFTVD